MYGRCVDTIDAIVHKIRPAQMASTVWSRGLFLLGLLGLLGRGHVTEATYKTTKTTDKAGHRGVEVGGGDSARTDGCRGT